MITRFLRDAFALVDVGNTGFLPTLELCDDTVCKARLHGFFRLSDHGSQYVSLLLGKTMGDNGIAPSMSAIQSPWDNAATESLMGIIKSECVHAKTFASREEATLEIFEYIECFYNKIRIHSALGWMSPNEFEEKMLLAA